MKKISIALMLMIALILQSWTQEPENNKSENPLSDTADNTKVVIGRDFIVVEGHEDTVDVKIGDRGITLLESLEGNGGMAVRKYDNSREHHQDFKNSDSDDDRKHERNSRKFKGHWTGVEIGFNNYLTSEKNIVLPAEIDYMTLHSGKSVNFNVNFAQLSLGLTRHIGFVTGLGLNWNNYKFDGNNNIVKGANGVIEVLSPVGNLEKSKLATLYLTLPFMLELQLPVNNGHINIAGGPIGAVKLSSHNKMVFESGQKLKSNGDFSLNILRCGATARAGYNNFQVYGTYYMTPLFRTGKGPGGYDLYPFEIGMAFTFND